MVAHSNNYRHGEGNPQSAEYMIWSAMKSRCCNPKNKNFDRYGARGIQVCERWRTSFANFLADLGRKPTPAHSIDRIDPNGNYEPGNCRWADILTQRRNREDTIRFEGKTIGELSEQTGLAYMLLYKRLVMRGWDLARALSTPGRKTA